MKGLTEIISNSDYGNSRINTRSNLDRSYERKGNFLLSQNSNLNNLPICFSIFYPKKPPDCYFGREVFVWFINISRNPLYPKARNMKILKSMKPLKKRYTTY